MSFDEVSYILLSGVAVFKGSPIRYNIATREATVSCSTTFFVKWYTFFFITLLHTLLWHYATKGALNTLNLNLKNFASLSWMKSPF